jgi:hypothetical protein
MNIWLARQSFRKALDNYEFNSFLFALSTRYTKPIKQITKPIEINAF